MRHIGTLLLIAFLSQIVIADTAFGTRDPGGEVDTIEDKFEQMEEEQLTETIRYAIITIVVLALVLVINSSRRGHPQNPENPPNAEESPQKLQMPSPPTNDSRISKFGEFALLRW